MIQEGVTFLNEKRLNRIYLSPTGDKNVFDEPLYVVMVKMEGEEPFELSCHATYGACMNFAKDLSERIDKLQHPNLYEYNGSMMMKQHRGVAVYG